MYIIHLFTLFFILSTTATINTGCQSRNEIKHIINQDLNHNKKGSRAPILAVKTLKNNLQKQKVVKIVKKDERQIFKLFDLKKSIKTKKQAYQIILEIFKTDPKQAEKDLWILLGDAPAYFKSPLFYRHFQKDLQQITAPELVARFNVRWYKSILSDYKINKDASERQALAQIAAFTLKHLNTVQASTGVQIPYFWEKMLYAELPETNAAQKWFKTQKNNSFALHLNTKLWIKRARNLEKMHDNQAVFKLLKTKIPTKIQKTDHSCEILYLLGKSARKVRHYKEAQNYLKQVVKNCGEPWAQKALYTQTRVATYGKSANSLTLIKKFLKSYPKSRYADDVTLWKAEYLLAKDKKEEAKKSYKELIQNFPHGDMLSTAHFAYAFMQMKNGENSEALKTLKEISQNTKILLEQKDRDQSIPYKDQKWTHIIAVDQSIYWQGRLRIYPQLSSWKENSNEAERLKGIKILQKFTQNRYASFYGDMANKILKKLKIKTEDRKSNTQNIISTSISAKEFPIRETTIEKNPSFREAVDLIHTGFSAEARIILNTLYKKDMTDSNLAILAFAFSKNGDLDKAHQIYRFAGKSLFWNPPKTAQEIFKWNLAYPRAYSDALQAAAKENNLPNELLIGLSREESAFQAEVISWAGAIGLCQLMPRTAREEANLLHISYKEDHEITDPFINARLGAHHLARRLKSLKHPFLAIAAYNAGPGNVRKWRKKYPYLPIDTFVESIPVAQTRNYVKKVTGSWIIYSLLAGKSSPDFEIKLP